MNKMLKGIITETEVVYHSGIDLDFQVCDLRTAHNVERFEFRECLGKEFYKTLQSALASYENITWKAKDEAGDIIEYEKDAVVVYNGIFKKALETTSAIPSDKSKWVNAPKFDDSKYCGQIYEQLWCDYLAEFIALSVVKAELPRFATRISKDGLIKLFGQNFQAADSKEVDRIAGWIDKKIAIVFSNMDDWLKDNNINGCFDNYKGIANTCCGDCGYSIENCDCDDSCVKGKITEGTYNFG